MIILVILLMGLTLFSSCISPSCLADSSSFIPNSVDDDGVLNQVSPQAETSAHSSSSEPPSASHSPYSRLSSSFNSMAASRWPPLLWIRWLQLQDGHEDWSKWWYYRIQSATSHQGLVQLLLFNGSWGDGVTSLESLCRLCTGIAIVITITINHLMIFRTWWTLHGTPTTLPPSKVTRGQGCLTV